MAELGSTRIDSQYLDETESLPNLLGGIQDLSRLLELALCGYIHDPGEQDGDVELLHSIAWPLANACRRAVEMERAARPPVPGAPEDEKALEVLDGGRA